MIGRLTHQCQIIFMCKYLRNFFTIRTPESVHTVACKDIIIYLKFAMRHKIQIIKRFIFDFIIRSGVVTKTNFEITEATIHFYNL